MKLKTFVDRLKNDLDNIKQTMFELLDNSRVLHRRDDPYSNVVFIAPEYYWDKTTDKEQLLQIELKRKYGQWIESFKIFVKNSPEDSLRTVEETNIFVIDWIEKNSNWSIPRTTEEAKSVFENRIQFFYDTLNIYSNTGYQSMIIIPDTNAIIQRPTPEDYQLISGVDRLSIVFLPTVLSELDMLKIKSFNPEFQKKVKSVISRLKGYRQQGNLLEGVTVNKSIELRMVASEPNFDKTLSWLDRENNDDRIIASALEIQRDNPSSTVCIVTSDINLQNKTEMAKLSYLDTD